MFKYLEDVRFRYLFMIFGIVCWLGATILTGDKGYVEQLPFGAAVVATLVSFTKIFVYLTGLHMSRKALVDYADLEELLIIAKTTAQGAGLAMIAIAIIYLPIALIICQVI